MVCYHYLLSLVDIENILGRGEDDQLNRGGEDEEGDFFPSFDAHVVCNRAEEVFLVAGEAVDVGYLVHRAHACALYYGEVEGVPHRRVYPSELLGAHNKVQVFDVIVAVAETQELFGEVLDLALVLPAAVLVLAEELADVASLEDENGFFACFEPVLYFLPGGGVIVHVFADIPRVDAVIRVVDEDFCVLVSVEVADAFR